MNRKGKTKVRYKTRQFGNGAGTGGFYDDEADLVQNNGRVTLPSSTGVHLRKSQLRVLIFFGASILIALLFGRK